MELLLLPVALFEQFFAVMHALTQPLIESIHISNVAEVSWIIYKVFTAFYILWIEADEVVPITSTGTIGPNIGGTSSLLGTPKLWCHYKQGVRRDAKEDLGSLVRLLGSIILASWEVCTDGFLPCFRSRQCLLR